MTHVQQCPVTFEGVQAEVIGDWPQMQPLCGELQGATAEASSMLWVSAQDHTLYQWPIFAQVGIQRSRKGSTRIVKGLCIEVKGGKEYAEPDFFQRCEAPQVSFSDVPFTIQKCQAGPTCQCGNRVCWEATIGPVFRRWLWHPTWNSLPASRAAWYGELINFQDKLCGDAQDPCYFDKCKVRLDAGSFTDAIIPTENKRIFPPAPGAWSIDVVSPTKVRLYDRQPNQ